MFGLVAILTIIHLSAYLIIPACFKPSGLAAFSRSLLADEIVILLCHNGLHFIFLSSTENDEK